jgi:hypothetical protein
MTRPPGAQPANPTSQKSAREEAEAEQRILGQVRLILPVVAVLATTAAGFILGPGPAVLVLAAFALIAAIESLWSSLQALLGETPLSREDAYAYGAPSAEEEQKRAVLRALKDLEFERGVGKISDADFEQLTAQYRAEAKRLLRVLDERSRQGREKVERLVDQLLKERDLAPSVGEPQGEQERDSDHAPDPSGHPCPHCQAGNDDDAVFCKKCGTRLEPDEGPE